MEPGRVREHLVPYIVYQGQEYDSLTLNISKEMPFREIFERINALSFPFVPVKDEHVRYALLELLGNSVRAHRAKDSDEEIRLTLDVRDARLHITITDHGGGFDITMPPNHRSFGKGLKLARKLFSVFEIGFYDENNSVIPYTPGEVIGTRIKIIV